MAKTETAVATRKTTQVAARANSVELVEWVEARRDQIATLFERHGDVDAFVRILKNAIIRDPQIAEADKQSVFLEVQKAAQDGLVLDGREAALVRFRARRKNGTQWENYTSVVYIPMILGIQKRARNTGTVASWSAALVYRKEAVDQRFRFWRDDLGMHLLHQPMIPAIDGEPGEVVAAYSAVRLKDGSVDYELMSVEELDGIMGRTRSKDKDGKIVGPWASDRGEMQKKTVMRRHSKRLEMSSEMRDVANRVDELYDFKRDADEEVYAMPDEAAPKSVRNKRNGSAADKLKKEAPPAPAEKDEEVPEPETIEGGPDGDEPPPPDENEAATGDISPDDDF